MVANFLLNPDHFLPNIHQGTDKTVGRLESLGLTGLSYNVFFSYSIYLQELNIKLDLVSLFNSLLL